MKKIGLFIHTIG